MRDGPSFRAGGGYQCCPYWRCWQLWSSGGSGCSWWWSSSLAAAAIAIVVLVFGSSWVMVLAKSTAHENEQLRSFLMAVGRGRVVVPSVLRFVQGRVCRHLCWQLFDMTRRGKPSWPRRCTCKRCVIN